MTTSSRENPACPEVARADRGGAVVGNARFGGRMLGNPLEKQHSYYVDQFVPLRVIGGR
jgi:hypothetical protein